MSDDPYDIVPSLSRETLLALIEKQKADIEKLRSELEAIKSPPDYGTQKIMNEQIHYAGIIAQKDRVIERQAETIEKLRAALKEARVKSLNEGFDIAILFNGMRRSEIAQAFERAKAAALKETGE